MLLFLLLFPPGYPSYESFDGEVKVLSGRVASKEYKRKEDGTLSLRVTLKQVQSARGDSFPSVPDGALAIFTSKAGKRPQRLSTEKQETEKQAADEKTADEQYLEALDDSMPIGCRVCLSGKIRNFSPGTNPGEFDSRLYYRTLGINLRLDNAALRLVSGRASPLQNTLYLLKRRLSGVLDRSLPEEDAGIMKAMLLGEKGFLSEELKSLYRESGILHVLAISGLHISLFGMGLYRLLRRARLSLLPSAALSAGFILLYSCMVNLSGSGVRAVIMFFLFLGAKVLYRTYDLLTAAAIAGAILAASDPLLLLISGFQFSFGAVLGIGIILPQVKSPVLRAAAVPAATLPVCLFTYGSFPLWSLLLNLAVVPLMSAVMTSGAVLVLAGVLIPASGTIFSLPVRLLLYFYRTACVLTSKLPGHRLVIGQPVHWQTALYIILLLAMVFASEKNPGLPEWKKASFILAAVFLLCFRPHQGLTLSFMDVGQGDGILIQADGTNILIDGGSSTKEDLAKYTLIPFLHSKGVGRLDGIILTHDDSDHCSGLLQFLEAAAEEKPLISLSAVYLPNLTEDAKGENYRRIEKLCGQAGIPVHYISRGLRLRSGDLTLDCLHPARGASYEDANEYSTTLLLRYRDSSLLPEEDSAVKPDLSGKAEGFSALLTGDLEGQGEEELLKYLTETNLLQDSEELPNIDVLKVAHHGSKNATSEHFLQLVHPDIAIISAGIDNMYGHPAEELLDRLESSASQPAIYRTDLQGEISFRHNKKGDDYHVKTFLGDTKETSEISKK